MSIVIASDHAGFEAKQKIISSLKDQHPLLDLGPFSEDRTDYPDYADKVAQHLYKNPKDVGILVCGSGQGMAMRANKYSHIRAALCWSEESAQLARAHNDANVLCLGGRLLDLQTVLKAVQMFLNTPFEGGRHAQRLEKLSKPARCS